MPPYLLPLPKPVCAACGGKATQQLFNKRNALIGHYCRPCGKDALKRAQAAAL